MPGWLLSTRCPQAKRQQFTSAGLPKMLKLLLFTLLPVVVVLAQQRHKHTDQNYNELIPIADIPKSCDNPPEHGYGIIEGENGGLEKCSRYLAEAGDSNKEDDDYEAFKCKNLRVNAEIVDGKCKCKPNWKGPLCNDFKGCPDGHTIRDQVCAPNSCKNDGVLSVGSSRIECRCNGHWDGDWCERLACWRNAPKEFEHRWRNVVDHCECADGFAGDTCGTITKCKNGELKDNRCVCVEGWKGDVCNRKCKPGQTCAAPGLIHGFLAVLAPVCGVLLFKFH
uniref:EGF-like domain-containing protein n=1 Tax=Panagrellus redivivus TaxID=6233 RepID=A0A7E4UVE1_PANRE